MIPPEAQLFSNALSKCKGKTTSGSPMSVSGNTSAFVFGFLHYFNWHPMLSPEDRQRIGCTLPSPYFFA
jgi:hypothetical protein